MSPRIPIMSPERRKKLGLPESVEIISLGSLPDSQRSEPSGEATDETIDEVTDDPAKGRESD